MFGKLKALFQSKPIQKPWRELHSKVVGVSHRNSDRTSRQKIIRESTYAGQGLDLGFEDDNKHDPHAVAVLCPGAGQIGYLDARLAHDVRTWHGEGNNIRVRVTDVTGGNDGDYLGVNILVQAFES